MVRGTLPLALEIAGSRVADAHASVSARPKRERNCMVARKEGFVGSFDEKTSELNV